ncbi:MAG: ferrous iron transporter B [Planctomycetota bacterium]
MLTHPVLGLLIFVGIMFVVFQAVFTWSGPLMDLIDGAFGDLGQSVGAALGEGAFSSLVEKGIIAGVGSVLIFLPQILILFLFIAILEDSGYMARAAFLTDRMMRLAGLSGQSFVPLLSSFACAIPGIMAARTIPDRKDRLTTILVAPLMSCSARLPVYTILISSFVPNQKYLGGWLSLQGLVMAAMYFVGIFTAMAAAVLIKRFMLRGPAPAFLMEMPPYRRPMLRAVAQRLWERGGVFVRRAGTIIFAVVLVVWVLSYFPRPEHIAQQYEVEREALAQQTDLDDAARADALADIDHREARDYLEQSAFGRIGHFIEPLFRPLGWDWRISAAAMASFPAREVVVAVLGTTFAVGDDIDVDDDDSAGTMRAALQNATWPDGRKLFNLPVALSLMVFFALCLQCGATVAAIKREANSWGWAIFAWCYMTGLAWVAACVVYQASYALLM